MKRIKFYVLAMVTASISCTSLAQETLDNGYVEKIVNEIAEHYQTEYTFPDKGLEVQATLLANLAGKKYQNLLSYDSLAAQLQRDIQIVTSDKHAAVFHRKKEPENDKESAPAQPSVNEFLKSIENYGFTDVEILEGNIGYVKMPVFFPIQMDEKAKVAADDMMEKFQKCKYIIFDLTACGGGDPNMISYLISYLYPENANVHLNDFFYRPTGATMSTYTTKVNGQPLPDVEVYVMISSKTFSAGEEFTYDLKYLERATIVGETSGGGAHTVEPRILDEQFELMMPTGRAINPITKTNWEGSGVTPHIKSEASKSLETTLKTIKNKS
ncbi:MAG: S41 family peptidase [Cyclobacteriaceae bacterium]